MLKSKIVMLAGSVVLMWACVAHAGDFNYGSTTYESVDSILIVNSLGDSTVESSDGAFGYNDYIPENAFKNNMKEQGYSVVYDSEPEGIDVTPVTYMGLLGDPRTEDVDYVLTSEYEALNAAEQDRRINEINERISNYDDRITNAISKAQRVADKLDATKIQAKLNVRLYDTKHFSLSAYGEHDFTHNEGDRIGVEVTLKLTKSYEEKKLEALERRIAAMEK